MRGSIFASELRRFRLLALAAALVHALPLFGVAVGGDLFLASEGRLVAAAFAYSALGLVLGVYQIVSYRRGDLWTFLLHRPLPARRIFFELSGVAILLLGLVIFLPLLLATAVSALGPVGVDPRHFALAPYAWLVALAFYFAGWLLALTPWRGAFLTAVLALIPWGLAPSRALGVWVFVPALLGLAVLAFIAKSAFRPDLSTPPRGRLATAFAVLPGLYILFLALSLAVLFAYSVGVIVREAGVRGFTTFSWNRYFPAGSYPRASYRNAEEMLEHGLQLGGLPPSRFAPEAVVEVTPWRRAGELRGQPCFLDDLGFLLDWGRRGAWTFRYDRMAFAGRDLRTGRSLGWMEAGGAPLPEVPILYQSDQVVTSRLLYRFLGDRPRLALRFTLPAGERFLAPAVDGSSFDLALSDRAVYFFAPGDLWGSPAEAPAARPFARVPLGGDASNLARVVAAPTGEGYLLSIELGSRSERGFAEARQVLLRVGEDGRSALLADAPLTPGLPAWERHRGFLVSPVFQAAEDLTRTALAGPGPGAASLGDLVAHPPPPSIVAGAFVCALLAAAASWLLAGRRGLTPGSRRAWTLAALLLGMPVPFALLLYTSRSA